MSGKARKRMSKIASRKAGSHSFSGGRMKAIAMFLSSVLLSFCLLGEDTRPEKPDHYNFLCEKVSPVFCPGFAPPLPNLNPKPRPNPNPHDGREKGKQKT